VAQVGQTSRNAILLFVLFGIVRYGSQVSKEAQQLIIGTVGSSLPGLIGKQQVYNFHSIERGDNEEITMNSLKLTTSTDIAV
jgi:hypothetical protein